MQTRRLLVHSSKFLITLLLLYLVFVSVDISKIGRDLKSFSAGPLILLCVLCWIGQLLCSERWRLFAAALGLRGAYRSFAAIYFAGMLFNIGLPSLVGGDVVKAYIISRKNGKSLPLGLASVLLDRGAGLLALLLCGSMAIVAAPMTWKGVPLWTAYALTWLAIAVLLLLVAKGDRLYRRILDAPDRPRLQKAFQTVADFHQALALRNLTAGAALRIAVYSIAYAGLVLWVFQQVTVAARHGVGLVQFSALFPLITLGTMLPITLGGLGVREWLYVEALSLAGVPRSAGLVISLATSALYIVVNLGGIPFLPAVPSELRPHRDQ